VGALRVLENATTWAAIAAIAERLARVPRGVVLPFGRPGEAWAMDCMQDTLASGRRWRMRDAYWRWRAGIRGSKTDYSTGGM
jgi:hypothetical protein